jgi:nitrogen fixation-related uncharacterized protein
MMMKIKRMGWAIAFAAVALLVSSPAYAHDAVAGEELAGAQEILIVSMALLTGGLIICFWAWRHGQFNNVEEPKYRMLEAESALDYACIEDPEDEDEVGVQFVAPHAAGAELNPTR